VYGFASDVVVPVLDESVGITEAIERALRKYPGKLLPPTSVRNALFEMGFKVAGNNPMASVHQVLKRLVARAGSCYVSQPIEGRTMYKFDPSREAARARLIVEAPQITGLAAVVQQIAELQNASDEAQKLAARRLADMAKAVDLSKHSAIKAITAMQQRSKK
jgi:hypothetical protein